MPSRSRPENPFFRYLRQLRADGRSNMYGAVPYLMKAFGLDREAAFGIVCQWLDREAAVSEYQPETIRRPARKLSA